MVGNRPSRPLEDESAPPHKILETIFSSLSHVQPPSICTKSHRQIAQDPGGWGVPVSVPMTSWLGLNSQFLVLPVSHV